MIPYSLVVAAFRLRLLVGLVLALVGLAFAGAPAETAPGSKVLPAAAHLTFNYRPFTYVHGARALSRAQPDEEIVLTLEGGKTRVPLTLRQLQAMPTVRYRTRHLQLKRSFTYQGVALRDLAIRGGFAGRNLRVYAGNGFVSTVQARDYMHHPIMLAYLADDRPISVLQKGPLTVVLPTTPGRFHSEPYSGAWVWFAERITPAP